MLAEFLQTDAAINQGGFEGLVPLDGETSFEKVRARQAQLQSGDEMTFRVLRAGQVLELKGRIP